MRVNYIEGIYTTIKKVMKTLIYDHIYLNYYSSSRMHKQYYKLIYI